MADDTGPKTPSRNAVEPVPRDARGRVLPGRSLNPTGGSRPQGLRKRIAALTNGGQAILEGFWGVWSGQLKGFNGKDRIKALEWLGDHYFGKAVETQVLIEANPEDTAALDVDSTDLEALLRTLRPGPETVEGSIVTPTLPEREATGDPTEPPEVELTPAEPLGNSD